MGFHKTKARITFMLVTLNPSFFRNLKTSWTPGSKPMGSKLLTALFFLCKLCFLSVFLSPCYFFHSFFLLLVYAILSCFLTFCLFVFLCLSVVLTLFLSLHLFDVCFCFFFSLSVCVLCLTLLSVFFHVHVALPLFLLFTLMSVFFHVHVVSPSMLWHILCNRSLVTRYALFCLLHYFLSLFVIFLNNLFRKLFQVWSIHLAFK